MQESCSSKSQACRLACIIIFIAAPVVFITSAAATSIEHDFIDRIIGEPCGDQTRCNWNIPRNPDTGCCPREEGETCHPEDQELCNSEFGLMCVESFNGSLTTEGFGICRGPFNLTATTIAQNQVTLEWTHFAPEDYLYEYALLLRQDTYHRDISRWDIRYCGAEPRCVMRRLTPGTTYLVKMALWEDIRAMTFGTTSETIVVVTKEVDHCEGVTEGSTYSVGESFIQEKEENCTCLTTGTFQCHLLCPQGIPELEEGCQVISGEECQYNISCNLPLGFEESEEELCYRYPEGTELRFDCRVCRCEKEALKCSYSEVCSALSPKPSCKNLREIKIPGECCPEWECEDVCEHENKSYSAGELFQMKGCGVCQCQPTGKVKCVYNCPPVEMVPPSLACPSPHIKRSGCCDTVHCFRNDSDLFSFIRDLAVLFTTSTSLTLGFEAKPKCEIDGSPSYCHYRIQYASTSTTPESHEWKNRIVHLVDVVHDGLSSNYSDPMDIFTKDVAIVINGRAVVTLTGMIPSTELYVVVTQEREVREDMTEIDSGLGQSSRTAKVVAKTRPLQNDDNLVPCPRFDNGQLAGASVTSCFYSGRVVLHGEIVPMSCDQACMCQLGQIVCQSTCNDENIVIAASLSCPRPQLEKRDGECCPKWQCNPSVSGCHYKNAILRPGQVISDGCQECVCNNSTVRCVSLCPPAGVSPRSGCVLTNYNGHCCPEWSCPLEKSTPVAVKSSVLLKFLGTCQTPVLDFKKSLAEVVATRVSELMNCSDVTSSSSLCNGLSAAVECSTQPSEQRFREKRSASEDQNVQYFSVLVSVRRNLSSEKDQEIVFQAGQDLHKLLNSSFSIRLPSGHTFQSSPGNRLRRPVYICQYGFSYKNGECVSSEIDIIGTRRTQIDVTAVDISQESVTFQWPPLSDSMQKHIATLHIKYRQTGILTWTSTKTLPSWRTSITVSGLKAGTSFIGSLVAVSQGHVNDDQPTWILGDTSFKTLSPSEDEALSSISLVEVSTTANSIALYWGHLTQEFWKQVEVASILYWVSTSNIIHKLRVENHEFPFTKIEALSPSTEYTIQMTVVLSNGQTSRSQSLIIETLPAEKCDHGFLLPIGIACCATVLLALVIFLVLMYWRNKKKNKNTAIENKLYGMSLENNTAPTNTNAGISTS